MGDGSRSLLTRRTPYVPRTVGVECLRRRQPRLLVREGLLIAGPAVPEPGHRSPDGRGSRARLPTNIIVLRSPSSAGCAGPAALSSAASIPSIQSFIADLSWFGQSLGRGRRFEQSHSLDSRAGLRDGGRRRALRARGRCPSASPRPARRRTGTDVVRNRPHGQCRRSGHEPMTSGHGGRRTETQGIKYRNNNSKTPSRATPGRHLKRFNQPSSPSARGAPSPAGGVR